MPKRIFVVEDNALNLRLFCDLLAAHGHETCAVRDGREAFAKACEYRPDLIITDIQLPYVSGFDLIRQFRQEASLVQVPIMAVTAYAGPGDEERIRAAGANIYVSKPISVVKFIAVVNQLFEIALQRQDEQRDPGSFVAA
ncbi:MAG: response regulator [Sphingobium sp.]